MDFSTIKSKLESNQYSSMEAFDRDMLVVEQNCYSYNPADDPIASDCRQVFAFYKREYRRTFNRFHKVGTPLTRKRKFPVGDVQRARKEGRANLAHSSAMKVISKQVDRLDQFINDKENTLRDLNADISFMERLKEGEEEVEKKCQRVQVKKVLHNSTIKVTITPDIVIYPPWDQSLHVPVSRCIHLYDFHQLVGDKR
ncbi:bromodomain-containing protein 2-like [Lineus longissimus]|uniref:bromodomain-containing protein 2-like n=1 Tax=Lineus longissimus TaxID=88925 RepID=UPI00315D082B